MRKKKTNKKGLKSSAVKMRGALDDENPWWPFEQELIIQPDRLKYIRRARKPDECVFCQGAEAKRLSAKSLVLYRSEKVLVFLNKYPYNNGHLLVLPREHTGELLDLTEEAYQAVMSMVRSCVKILKEEYQCQGLNIGLNHGAVSGAGIPGHIHWHVIPRWFGDTNFFPLIAETKVLPEKVETMYKRLRPHFKELK